MQVKEQIVALERAKEFHHEKYLNNIQVIDDRIDRIEKQLEKTKSQVKRDLLKRTLDWYEEEINKMDEAVDVVTTKIDSEIQRLQEIIKSAELRQENEKKSLDYNIQKIRECARDRNVYRIVDALEFVANALEIIKANEG